MDFDKAPKGLKTNPNNEFQNWFENLDRKISDSSAKLYYSQYLRVFNHFDRDLLDLDYKTITEYLETLTNLNNRKNYLNLFIMLNKKPNETLYKKLDNYRNNLKKDIDEKLKETNKDLCDTLPEYDVISKFANKQTGRGYLVNYILLNFGVRAKDLDVIITKDNEDILNNHNYLILDGKTVKYIRNVYKTVKAHGTQEQIIKDRKFVKTVSDIIEKEGEDVRMFSNKQSDKALRKYTYEGLSEGDVFKVLVCELFNKKQFSKLYKYGELRGTNIDVILKSYNMYYQKEMEDKDKLTISTDTAK